MIANEYSHACLTLLGCDPAGCAADELLFPTDEKARKQMRECIADALAESDPSRKAIFLSLIPKELHIADLVFADGLSSREVATELSGRGVGMAAVRAEVGKLGGEVRVESRPAQGTSFIFRIPLLKPKEV